MAAPSAPLPTLARPDRFDRWLVVATVGPLVAFSLLHLAGTAPAWFVGLSLLLGAPHVMATLGLYADRDLRPVIAADRRRCIWGPLAVVPASAAALALAPPPGRVLLVTTFFLWQTQHYTKQNVGVFGLWVRARGEAPMTDRERRLITATTAIGALGIVRAMELVPAWDRWLQAGGLALIAAMAAVAATTAGGTRGGALLVAVAFYAPLHLFGHDLLGAAFAYQAAHGAQYYLVVGRTLAAQPRARQTALVAVLVGGVVAIVLLAPAVLVTAPLLFGAAKGLAAAHFLADARLWRLRDANVRAYLVERLPFLAPAPLALGGVGAAGLLSTARSSGAAPSR